ncbi:MAG: hypothetical protein NTX22_11690 [Ignavibacteriales bacterium]|nr:hypothetical protein [Ignavibacteriales bacterium]
MRIKSLLILLAAFFVSQSFGQIHSINLSGAFSQPMSKRLKVNKINALGGEATVSFDLYKDYHVNVSFGYNLYSVSQDSALEKWNWVFWLLRYKGIVNDALAKYSYLKATLSPVQKMDLYPLFVTASADFELIENIHVGAQLGGGVIFYTRRLYLHESWQKYFSTLDYEFKYDYYNFADPKSGNPFALVGGLNVGYEFLEGFVLDAGFKYVYILKTEGKYGYNELPMSDLLNIKLGLTFLY